MGTAKLVVTDNASYFISHRFQQWLNGIGTQHLTIAPYHPQSNGTAERFVSTIKQHIKACNSNDLQAVIDRFLHQYRNSAHSITHKSPAKMMFGRSINTPLNNMLNTQVSYWTPNGTFSNGTVLSNLGNRMVSIRGDNGNVVKRHFSQLKVPPPVRLVPDIEFSNSDSIRVRRSERQRRPVQRYGID